MPDGRGVLVESVLPGTRAAEAGIEPGARILSVSGRPVEDLLDLHFLTARRSFTIRWASPAGEIQKTPFRGDGTLLGIRPEPIRVGRCRNRCIFCFVHQLPPGLRKSLYVKDEDVRLSFLNGQYVTFSDVTEEELRRIIRYRMSPLYVSIHATDAALRRKMLGNPRAADIVPVIRRLVEAGIVLHGQIVVCPGLNDGARLEQTLSDLSAFHPGLASVAVVPVGITSHRKGLYPLRPVTPAEARATVDLVERFRRVGRNASWEPFATAADEYYLLAGRAIPSRSRYGSFPQVENGVGLVRLFLDEARTLFRRKAWDRPQEGGAVATGVAARRFVAAFLEKFSARSGKPFVALPVENRLFGPTVTVTGLLAARDIAAAARKARAKRIFVPAVCLRDGGDLFLDGLSPEEFGREAEAQVLFFEPTPKGFYDAACGAAAVSCGRKTRYNN